MTYSNIIEGHKRSNDIKHFWKDRFQNIFPSNNRFLSNKKIFLDFNHEMYVSENEVAFIILKLKRGKSTEPDKLFNEILIFSSNILYKLLSYFLEFYIFV